MYKTNAMKKYTLLIFVLSLGFLFSCKPKDEDKPSHEDEAPTTELKARVNIIPTYQGTPMDFNQNYTTQEGYTISFTKLNIIMSEFKNNENQLFKSAIYKFDKDKKLLWEGVGDYSQFSSFTAKIGLNSTLNHSDPSAKETDDPLFILNSGDMHWGWSTGYIFVMLEGKADTTAAQSGSLASFSFHIGNDDMTRDFSLTDIQWNKLNSHLYETNIYLDLSKVFDNGANSIDIKTERTSHTGPTEIPLSEKFIDNFMHALSK